MRVVDGCNLDSFEGIDSMPKFGVCAIAENDMMAPGELRDGAERRGLC